MICLLLNNAIVAGPCAITDPSVRQALYVAGFTEAEGVLRDPSGNGVTTIPATDPATALTLAEGYAIWPVAVTTDNAPVGEMVTGHVTALGQGVVTVTPQYGAAPVIPKPTQIAKVDFLKRFQSAELIAAKALEATDPNVAVFWEQFRAITDFVDLADPDVNQSVAYMESKGVLTADRAKAILTP